MCSVLSAQTIATTKVAIIVCNHPEVRREILCAPGTAYHSNILRDEFCRKRRWNNVIETKSAAILEKIGLPNELHEVVIATVFLVGIRMLNWAHYHERIICLEREYSVKFLNSSFFTHLGTIDNKKAAEKLINDEYLTIQQRYKTACLYCFRFHISELHTKMNSDDWEMFYNAQNPNKIDQPIIVKFWTYYLKDEIDKLKGDMNFDQYLLELVVNCGNQTTVEYYLQTANLRKHSNPIIAAAVGMVEKLVLTIIDKDFLIFNGVIYEDDECLWVPSEYYADILGSLLLKMNEDQKKEFFNYDIRGESMEHTIRHYKALESFLHWPYQNRFMEFAKLLLGTSSKEYYAFPEREFAVTLLNICYRIEPDEECLNYGEEKTFNYRKLLKVFWQMSPEHFKRYVLSDLEEVYRRETVVEGQEKFEYTPALRLLFRLLSLTNFTLEDKEFIKLFLTSATFSEKECIIFSLEWREFYIELIREEELEKLNRFELKGFLPKEKINRFKRELSFERSAQLAFTSFALRGKFNALDTFIMWSSLSDEEVKILKKGIIHSQDAREAFAANIKWHQNVEAFDKFVRWCFTSEEEIQAFKKEFVFSTESIFRCITLEGRQKLEMFNKVIYYCLSSEEDIKRLKKSVAYGEGLTICKTLITGDPLNYIYVDDDRTSSSSKFDGGKWEEVEQFLTWCFSSEEERSEFKKKLLFKEFGKEIHFNLIKSKQWKEDEIFLRGLDCLLKK